MEEIEVMTHEYPRNILNEVERNICTGRKLLGVRTGALKCKNRTTEAPSGVRMTDPLTNHGPKESLS